MISNRNGRALEFALVEAFGSLHANTNLVGNTFDNQQRDSALFNQLNISMQTYYEKQCKSFAQWVLSNKFADTQSLITIRRLTDQDAVAGDVTDIRLISGAQEYNISLKHNHEAVKHQRPGNLFAQLGVDNKIEEKAYRGEIKSISNDFFERVSVLNTVLFKEVKEIDESIINDFYEDMCHLVADTINSQRVDAQSAFNFLVGNCNFDKVIVTADTIKVMEFSDIQLPTFIKATKTSYNRVKLEFDNGFKFDMRLHTASSKFAIGKTISQKFDTKLIEHSVNYFNL
ncbi:HaeIII family restriction endonuclease [Vibrio chagasii]|uniref:HaeIII family restriction endonuclease n=1 Tax=Vibrio chagasii TaxID=170679 RepID=UPI003DA0E99B